MIDPGRLNAVKQEIDRMISTAEAHTTFMVDVMKHLTTVATGVIVLFAALHEKFAHRRRSARWEHLSSLIPTDPQVVLDIWSGGRYHSLDIAVNGHPSS